MKLSSLVEALQELMDERGDVTAYCLGYNDEFDLVVKPMAVGIVTLEDGPAVFFGSVTQYEELLEDMEKTKGLN